VVAVTPSMYYNECWNATEKVKNRWATTFERHADLDAGKHWFVHFDEDSWKNEREREEQSEGKPEGISHYCGRGTSFT
jgi:hypothetical protein